MGAGRKAAASIHNYLTTGDWDAAPVQATVQPAAVPLATAATPAK
jgi:hypothetical protein